MKLKRIIRTDVDYNIPIRIEAKFYNTEIVVTDDKTFYKSFKINNDSVELQYDKVKSIIDDYIKTLNRPFVYYNLDKSASVFRDEDDRQRDIERYGYLDSVVHGYQTIIEIQVCNSGNYIEEEYHPFGFLINGLSKVFGNER